MNRIALALLFLIGLRRLGVQKTVMKLEVHEPEWTRWRQDATKNESLCYEVRPDLIVLDVGGVHNYVRLYVKQREE